MSASPWGTSDYPPDWDSRRRQVYKRDNYTCQECGARGGRYGEAELHAHHIIPKSKGGSHDLSNLTTLCWVCHNDVHDHYIPRREEVEEVTPSSIEEREHEEQTPSYDYRRVDDGRRSSKKLDQARWEIRLYEAKFTVPAFILAFGGLFLGQFGFVTLAQIMMVAGFILGLYWLLFVDVEERAREVSEKYGYDRVIDH